MKPAVRVGFDKRLRFEVDCLSNDVEILDAEKIRPIYMVMRLKNQTVDINHPHNGKAEPWKKRRWWPRVGNGDTCELKSATKDDFCVSQNIFVCRLSSAGSSGKLQIAPCSVLPIFFLCIVSSVCVARWLNRCLIVSEVRGCHECKDFSE